MRLILVAALLGGCLGAPAPPAGPTPDAPDPGTVDATPWETGEALDHCPYALPSGALVVTFRVTWEADSAPVPGACVHASLKGASETTYVRVGDAGTRTWRLDPGEYTLIATTPAAGDPYCAHEHVRNERVAEAGTFEFALPARAGVCA